MSKAQTIKRLAVLSVSGVLFCHFQNVNVSCCCCGDDWMKKFSQLSLDTRGEFAIMNASPMEKITP